MRSLLRLLARHWAPTLVVLFALLALLTGYQMWRAGPLGALSLLPQLAICLVVVVAVLVIRHLVKGLFKGTLARGTGSASKEIAKEAVAQGLSRGQTALKSTVAQARGTLTKVGGEVAEGLESLLDGKPSPPPTVTTSLPRCPSCNRFVRAGARFCDGCGAALPATCPHCGRALRPQAKFCDGCGNEV